ncbi:GNAT family N-acetyltransferase [Primorskyibacter sp. 2E107]|uniref:GNAT family N-acetyltransferase n=1 Tax=Primorskyibacter sp. 2E107 TaxID=3403458 RepID=UPI003AF44FAD
MTLQVEEAENRQDCFDIRRTVFIEEQGFSEEDEWDDLDATSIHLLISDGGRPLATARLLVQDGVGKIGRICVLKEGRGKGLGAMLVRYGLEHFRDDPDVTLVKLGAQVHALGFYEKLGFTAFGPEYLDGTVPHREMRCAV